MLEIAAKESEASQRTETTSEMMGINNATWNPDEQKLLEQVFYSHLKHLWHFILGPENFSRLNSREMGLYRRDCAQQVQEGLHEEVQGAGWADQGQEGRDGSSQEEVLALQSGQALDNWVTATTEYIWWMPAHTDKNNSLKLTDFPT